MLLTIVGVQARVSFWIEILNQTLLFLYFCSLSLSLSLSLSFLIHLNIYIFFTESFETQRKRQRDFFPLILYFFLSFVSFFKISALMSYKLTVVYHHHHHHHVVPLARISLTISRHFSLSFIASGRSSGLHPVSSHSCCM